MAVGRNAWVSESRVIIGKGYHCAYSLYLIVGDVVVLLL